MPTARDPRIDDYLHEAAPFARPILEHLRVLVHRGCPEAEETMKWSMPHFMAHGKILCGMAAFKRHCSFGFRHRGMERELGPHGAKAEEGMGSFGRITSLKDLPNDATMVRLIRRAAELNASDEPGRPRAKRDRTAAELAVPADFAAGLKKRRAAAATFRDFSPSHRKEYIRWITDAKREETRRKRLETALNWLAEGKPRNWKYI